MTIHWVLFHVWGNPVYVNMEHIVSFHGDAHGETRVYTRDGRSIVVDESVAWIVMALEGMLDDVRK